MVRILGIYLLEPLHTIPIVQIQCYRQLVPPVMDFGCDAFQRKAAERGFDLRRSVATTLDNSVGYKAKLPQADTLHTIMTDAAAGLDTDLDVESHTTARGPVFNVTRPLAIA